jgi:hypothetical protein
MAKNIFFSSQRLRLKLRGQPLEASRIRMQLGHAEWLHLWRNLGDRVYRGLSRVVHLG